MLLALAACGDALDTTRQSQHAPSLGASLYEEVCRRVAYSDDPKDVSGQRTFQTCRFGAIAPSHAGPRLLALSAERQRFVAAIDKAVDPNMAEPLRQLLTSMLPLYDDGTMQAHMAAVTTSLAALTESPDALAALGRLAARRGYVPSGATFAQAWLSYPRLEHLTRTLLETPAAQDPQRWHQLQQALAEPLQNAPEHVGTQPAAPFGALAQFLLSPLDAPEAPITPRWIVKRDIRGVAMPTMQGRYYKAPFVDRDGDGLADIDHAGRYIGVDGLPLHNLPTPFPVAKHKERVARTPHARALRDDGALWYQYTDAAPTVLAKIFEQLRLLFAAAPDAALPIAQVLQASMGPQQQRVHTFADQSQIVYQGFDASASPYIDVVQGLLELGQGPYVLQATAHAQTLWQTAESQLASLVDLGFLTAQLRQQDATRFAKGIEANTPWAQDLLDVAAQIAAEPGLIQDLIAAFADSRTATLGPRLAEQMRYVDRIDFDPDDVNAAVRGDFKTPTDPDAPDILNNQSIFERLLHLVHDASGQRICSNALDFVPSYAPCELFDIEDAAVFYVRAMVGKATLALHVKADDEFVSSQLEGAHLEDPNKQHSEMESFSGIDGFEQVFDPNIIVSSYDENGAPQGPHAQYRTFRVTPQAAARLLFSMYDERISADSPYGETRPGLQMLTPRLLIEGQPFDAAHWGTLFAWEKNGFFEAMQPLLQAFAKHDREDLLVRLVCVLHSHWQSPQSDTTQNTDGSRLNYARQTGLSRLEPLFARLLDEGNMLGRLGALAQASLDAAGAHGGGTSDPTAALLEHALLHLPQDAQALRQMPQAAQDLRAPTPAHLLVRGLGEIAANTAAVASAPSQKTSLMQHAVQQMLRVEPTPSGLRFANRQAQALVGAWLDFAQARLQSQHNESQARSTSADVLQVRAMLDSMPLQLGVQLAAELGDDASLAEEIGGILQHLLGPCTEATLAASSDALQILGDRANLTPLLQQAAVWLTPRTGVISQSMHLLSALQQIDTAHSVPQLLQGLVRDMGEETPLAALMDIFARVNRQIPGDDDILAAEDFSALFAVLDHLIKSPEHGFARLVQLVQSRRPNLVDVD